MTQTVFLAITLSAVSATVLGAGCQQTPTSGTSSESSSGSMSSGSAAQDKPRHRPTDWLSWRGPNQEGSSNEKGLPTSVDITREGSWTFELSGRGTPVIANGRVFGMGYRGTEENLQEILYCVDEKTGALEWEKKFTDFITDTIYYRFSIGSPTVDPETGDVFYLTTSGLVGRISPDGKPVWEHSTVPLYGKLTFPNGRTGSPLIDEDRCVIHIPTSGWGPQGPARDRFFAFDKKTGLPLWSCTPGGPPKDGSFSFPVVGYENGQRVLYAGLAGGFVACINARTGNPVWRFPLATGGLSVSVVKYKDTVIAVHGKENIDDSTIGRMVSIRCGKRSEKPGTQVTLTHGDEAWRNNKVVAFTSSPVLVGDRIYETGHTGELYCIDADTGKILWKHKLAPDQIHASPTYGDGKLYVPMNNGTFFIIEPSDEGAKVLQELTLEGACLGAPAISGGRVYVHTTAKLYCFSGGTGEYAGPPASALAVATAAEPPTGEPIALQVIPGDICLKTDSKMNFRVRSVDRNGRVVAENVEGVSWKNVPNKGVTFSKDGEMVIGKDAASTATNMLAEANGLNGSSRVRIVPGGDFTDDFNDVVLEPHPKTGEMWAFPRSHWPGAKPKWAIVELEGEKVLAKTLTNPLFQRTITPIGYPDARNYTMQVDIRTDGNRRIMSSAGVVNQRFLIILSGNYQEVEVSSTMELFRKSAPFSWKAKVWYTLKTRVDVNKDGSGVVRAKVWKRGDKEPDAWTIEAQHPNIHTHGAPGLYGFVPQSRFRAYMDNISVKSND